jgi:hypothetical protein
MEMDMTKHTNESTQYLDMYGTRVCLRQTRCFEIEVSFMGGTHNDGEELKSFPNMAEALKYVADIADDLEQEEGDDWGDDEDSGTETGTTWPAGMTRHVCTNSMTVVDEAKNEARLRDIARGAIESHLGDVLEGEETPDMIFEHAYTIALDRLMDEGVPARTARNVAQDVATCLAQP